MASPQVVSGAVARAKIRSEYIFALDLFGSFSIKGKGTKTAR